VAAKKKTPAFDYEAAIEELEALVERLEEGDAPLETALKDFERGIELTRSCQAALREAEQKVQILLKADGEPRDFVAGEADTGADPS